MITKLAEKYFPFFVILLLYFGCSACALSVTDIGPDRPNDAIFGGASTAGLVIGMAGDKNNLYAIGLNSGVWTNGLNNNKTFNSWSQLPNSPRYAYCIASDPNNALHIAVGEREGDAINLSDNHCGVWESFDGGRTFDESNYFDPMAHCQKTQLSHVVNGVVITNNSTVIITTPCGIARKEYGQPGFTYPTIITSEDNPVFNTIAIFKDLIVARTANFIFISRDDGKSWVEHIIRLNFPGQEFTLNSNNKQAGVYSVCILQEPVSGKIFVYVPAALVHNTNNFGSVLIFDNSSSTWNFQFITERGLGIGFGGSVFVKSFFSPNNNLQNSVGGNTNLFYCEAQNIFMATAISADGTATWLDVANTETPVEKKPQGIHPDIWDFLLDPSGWYAWISCDGGVYYYPLNPKQSTIGLGPGVQYLNLNSGLHTLHAHECFVAGFPGTRGEEHYGFVTQDNGNWAYIHNASGYGYWEKFNLGDVSIIEGDQGNPNFLFTASSLQFADLISFSDPPPSGIKTGQVTALYKGQSFQFIQTLNNEGPDFFMDAVALTTLPLQFEYNGAFINVPSALGSQTGPAIIRNTAYMRNPNFNTTLGAVWALEFNDLPEGAEAFWVSGGHADPTYFLLCDRPGATILFNRKKSESTWRQLTDPSVLVIGKYDPDKVQHGPVFVNPYNPNEIYISCVDGIYHGYQEAARNFNGSVVGGGFSFTKDEQLTNLVSQGGKYTLAFVFPGGNEDYVRKSNQSTSQQMYCLSWLSFNRYNTGQVVASSPYTGVFFKDGKADWRDLSSVLPKPFTPVSSVFIDNQGIYLTEEGRGMLKISNY